MTGAFYGHLIKHDTNSGIFDHQQLSSLGPQPERREALNVAQAEANFIKSLPNS